MDKKKFSFSKWEDQLDDFQKDDLEMYRKLHIESHVKAYKDMDSMYKDEQMALKGAVHTMLY